MTTTTPPPVHDLRARTASRGLQSAPGTAVVAHPEVRQARASRRAHELLSSHGGPAYSLACALLGDDVAALRIVALATADLARSTEDLGAGARRALARHVYWRCREVTGETSESHRLPPAMVRLRKLAQLQRTCLALCIYGGHTHRQAADLLGVAPLTVAVSLTSGLKDLGHLGPAQP